MFHDDRGAFFEAWHEPRYQGLGICGPFVQDNVSRSHPGVLRGLHVQNPHAQGKLLQVVAGAIWDVAVDVRAGSPTFGQWEGYELSQENACQFYIPPGFAHGFVVLDGPAIVSYKCTSVYDAASELTIRFDDPDIGIEWPIYAPPIVSAKDREGARLRDVPPERLRF